MFRRYAFCLALSMSLLSGCYSLTIQSFRDEAVLFNTQQASPVMNYIPRKHFYREQLIEYIFGMNAEEHLTISRLLQQEAQPGEGIINLRVQRTYRPLDVLVSVFTLGIYSRTLVVVEGDVVKW